MEVQELKIEYEPTDKIVTYRNNAKIHTGEQVMQIAKSIEEFGFNDPIGVWTNADGESEIVEGHGRLIAAKELGIEEVPVIHLDRMSDEQRRAYTHVHNQLAMNTGWDFETLEMDLEELGGDFEKYGFEITVEEDFDFDEPIDSDDNGGLESSVSTLVVGGKRYLIAEDEEQMLIEGLNRWSNEHSVCAGYIRSLYEAALR